MSDITPKTRRNVLFVDDEPGFLELVAQAAGRWSQGLWDIHVAESAGKALFIIQDQAIDLVVVDVNMPVVDGVQFLNLIQRKYPSLQKVVLTGFATEPHRAACLSAGAELFMEKPVKVDGYSTIFSTLDELMKLQPEEGFHGVLRRVGLPEVIQMECLSRHSTVLEVLSHGLRGTIYIQDGELVHAQLADKTGVDAFNQLINFSTGEFNFKTFTPPETHTLEGNWEFLIMEAVRLRDEGGLVEIAGEELAPEISAASESRRSEIKLEYTVTPSGSGWAGRAESRTVEEVLICSSQGEVLHEFQCLNQGGRLNLLEFVSSKSRQIAQALSLGDLERVEMQNHRARATMRLASGWGAFVRSKIAATDAEVKDFQMMTPDQTLEWLKREAPQAGVLAAVVRQNDGNVRALSYSPRYTADSLRGACQFLFNAYEVAHLHRLPHEMMRWTFTEAEVYSACRTDGLMLVLLLGIGESITQDRLRVENLLLVFTAAD